jgi:hypothetical protein
VFEDGRRLGGVERLYRVLDHVGGTRFAVVARVRGDVDPELLRGALIGMRERHPLLGCRIDRRGGVFSFRRSGVPATTLAVTREAVTWEAAVEEELACPLDVGRGPLVRTRLLPTTDGTSALVLTFDHSAADGRSATRAVAELVRSVSESTTSVADPGGSFTTLGQPLEDFLPAKHRGVRGFARLAMLQAGRSLARLWRGFPRRLPRDASAPWRDHRVQTWSHRLDAEQTGRLIRTARRRGTTVHGAVTAAQLRAIAAESGRSRVLLVGHPVDLRGRTSPVDASGVHVSGLDTAHRVGPRTDPWALAQEVRNDLVRAIDRGEPGFSLPITGALTARAGWLLGPGPTGATRLARLGSISVPYATTVTNLGDLGPTTQGPLEELHFAFSPPAPLLFGSAVSSFGGRLRWTFCWREPMVHRERGERLATRSVELLLSSMDKA